MSIRDQLQICLARVGRRDRGPAAARHERRPATRAGIALAMGNRSAKKDHHGAPASRARARCPVREPRAAAVPAPDTGSDAPTARALPSRPLQ